MAAFVESSVRWLQREEETFAACVGVLTHAGYPLIMRDTPVTGGVLYTGIGEAIVADPEAMPDPYDELYGRVVAAATEGGIVRQEKALANTSVLTAAHMPQSIPRIDAMMVAIGQSRGYETARNGMAVNAGECIRNRVSLCSSLAVINGVMFERLIADGYIPPAAVSVDFNLAQRVGAPKPTGHAWMRMEQSDTPDKILIRDRRLRASLAQIYPFRDMVWPVIRPEDEPMLARYAEQQVHEARV
ncbi:MAG TPA: hypothetical protein VD735_07415 [Candidatus Saccharimonadales bacterium]|nr:hypothetical protein [Candidatus Saccharimonadales bacterium]